MRSWIAYCLVLTTVLLTVSGQFLLKWQVLRAGALPADASERLHFLLRLLLNPWVLSAFAAAFLASVTWMMAMTKLQLSHAYPMTALTFALVVFGSAVLFHEPVTPLKVVGLVLIVAGIVVGSQG
ncbi:EamA family transporter [Lysobacter sp. KIS68-7]|uniref:EamA family transporter n=1 Tax=Lysobacter sp. KIS68-7 TaxID=2904252 RepID=UPI001E37D417|nr:EamA family transporter [Lysobacter sp. KIS68-7]UHQ20007.1 EamA family transporter [Lysobacter sp. KIS68-7]